MSYCRLPYMIYPSKKGIVFDLNTISDDKIDVFLYKIFLTRRDELVNRIKHGKESIMKWQEGQINGDNHKESIEFYKKMNFSDEEIKEITKYQIVDSVVKEAVEYKQWLLDKEDEFFKEFVK